MTAGATKPRSARWKWAWSVGKKPPGRDFQSLSAASRRPKRTVNPRPVKAMAMKRAVNLHRSTLESVIATLTTCIATPAPTMTAAMRSPGHRPGGEPLAPDGTREHDGDELVRGAQDAERDPSQRHRVGQRGQARVVVVPGELRGERRDRRAGQDEGRDGGHEIGQGQGRRR